MFVEQVAWQEICHPSQAAIQLDSAVALISVTKSKKKKEAQRFVWRYISFLYFHLYISLFKMNMQKRKKAPPQKDAELNGTCAVALRTDTQWTCFMEQLLLLQVLKTQQ